MASNKITLAVWAQQLHVCGKKGKAEIEWQKYITYIHAISIQIAGESKDRGQ